MALGYQPVYEEHAWRRRVASRHNGIPGLEFDIQIMTGKERRAEHVGPKKPWQ